MGCCRRDLSSPPTFSRAAFVLMPPTSIPAIFTPLAIVSRWPWSYRYKAAAPTTRTARDAAMMMKDRLRTTGLTADDCRSYVRARTGCKPACWGVYVLTGPSGSGAGRAAGHQKELYRVDDLGALRTGGLVAAQRLEVGLRQRGQDCDHLDGLERVVFRHRCSRARGLVRAAPPRRGLAP